MAEEEPIRDRIARYRNLKAAINDQRAQDAIEALCIECEARADGEGASGETEAALPSGETAD